VSGAGAPKVSIITPTFGRETFLPFAHQCFRSQTYANLEWLILDDSPAPSRYLAGVADPRIRYSHSPERLRIGGKRNRLIAQARGEIIVHFDDDDYYAPRYVERMVERLDRGFDFVKLSGWYLYCAPYRVFGYWDLNAIEGRCHLWSASRPPSRGRLRKADRAVFADNYLGYGFSYAFRRKVWEARPFPDGVDWNEDAPFALAARGAFRFHHFRDIGGLCLHILHRGNVSRCFPQYKLPSFVLRWLFPAPFIAGIEAADPARLGSP